MARAKKSLEKELLRHILEIGADDFVLEDEESGAIEVTTHLKALARITWKEALGYHVTNEVQGKDGVVHKIKTYRAPDRYAKQILFDHLLGKPKPPTAKDTSKKPKAPPAHERVDEALANHLNTIAEDSHVDGDSSGRKDKATTKNSLSERLRVLGLSKDKPEGS